MNKSNFALRLQPGRSARILVMAKHQCADCHREIEEGQIVWFGHFGQRDTIDAGTPTKSILLSPGLSQEEFEGAIPFHLECFQKSQELK